MTGKPLSPKQYVLRRFPDAHTAITALWPDGTPRHVTVIVGNQRLELPRRGDSEWFDDNLPQSAILAWREAYYWCLKNPEKRSQTDLFEEENG